MNNCSKFQNSRLLHRAHRKYLYLGTLLFPLALLAACAGTRSLLPAPASTVPGDSNAGASEADGVHVVAVANDWSGRPLNLDQIATPLLVTIRNRSGRSIEIRYRDFVITDASGARFAALPPYRIDGEVPSSGFYPVVPEFAYDGFLLAPAYARFYDWDFDDWDGPLDWDMGYYGEYYPMWSVPLPTRDMLRRGIPEGILENGGILSGFLYFQKVNRSSASRLVDFDFDLNEPNGKQFGTVRIPFIEK